MVTSILVFFLTLYPTFRIVERLNQIMDNNPSKESHLVSGLDCIVGYVKIWGRVHLHFVESLGRHAYLLNIADDTIFFFFVTYDDPSGE